MTTTTHSRTTDQGSPMAEATLCAEHYIEPYITYANVWAGGADDAGTPEWSDSTENAAVSCVECGLAEQNRVV